MRETEQIVYHWKALKLRGSEGILATVIAVNGSSYRRPGARMLITTEGWLAGSVSGGCLEEDILKKAWWQTRDGSAVVTYDSSEEDDLVWGFGLGCNGVVQILLERISAQRPGPLDLLQAVLDCRLPGVIATVIEGAAGSAGDRLLLYPDGKTHITLHQSDLVDDLLADARAALQQRTSALHCYELQSGQSVTVQVETLLPPHSLVIFGGGHDAVPLVRLAKELGWRVTIADPRETEPRIDRFPDADLILIGDLEDINRSLSWNSLTSAVVMTHSYPQDLQILRMLLQSSVGYIGQLGPRARTERLLAEIREQGALIMKEHRERLHSPAGLDIGAEAPEQIALAIAAEIHAFQNAATGRPLREKGVRKTGAEQ